MYCHQVFTEYFPQTLETNDALEPHDQWDWLLCGYFSHMGCALLSTWLGRKDISNYGKIAD